jgi:hypothetical protein
MGLNSRLCGRFRRWFCSNGRNDCGNANRDRSFANKGNEVAMAAQAQQTDTPLDTEALSSPVAGTGLMEEEEMETGGHRQGVANEVLKASFVQMDS